MSFHTSTSTPRRYCEYNDGRISRKYLNRTRESPRHHLRTDKIGSRYSDWRRKDTLDLQCSTQHTRQLIRDREDQLWATNPRNKKGVDPLANVLGWYSGHIDQTAWVGRKLRCYRRIRPVFELRSKQKNSALHQAYHRVKAEREADEGERANVLTPHEQGRLKAMANDPDLLIMAEAKRAETEAAKQKEELEGELQNILATLATGVPSTMASELPRVVTPSGTPPLQMHPDRLAQLEPYAAYQQGVSTQGLNHYQAYQLSMGGQKPVETEAELRRRRALKIRRAKAKLEGIPFEDQERQQGHDSWQAPGQDFV